MAKSVIFNHQIHNGNPAFNTDYEHEHERANYKRAVTIMVVPNNPL